MPKEFIERQIIIGLIVSTPFVEQIHNIWDSQLLTSSTAKTLADWCIEYFKKYGKAPEKDIEGIFNYRLKKGLQKEDAEWIENILEGLSDEYEHATFNVEYLIDQSKEYLRERHLHLLADNIKGALESGEVIEAEETASSYLPITNKKGKGFSSWIDPFSQEAKPVVEQAFAERANPLFEFGGKLGEFWNYEFTRDGFVALMGHEKIGKSFLLLELSIQAARANLNAAFFQAGDMTKKQQIRRLGLYFAKKSDQQRYCGELLIPTIDCIRNQLDTCNKNDRERNMGIGISSEDQLKELSYAELAGKFNEYPDHYPCHNCEEHEGTVWFKLRKPINSLGWKEAYRKLRKFQRAHAARFRLDSYSNGTLTTSIIRSQLNIWERKDGFIPDIIVVDYADILAPDSDAKHLSTRDQKNDIWQRLRGLSEERHCLVVTATQAAATAYDKKGLLTMKDFSEDKRQYAHVTAMYGLNQTDEEKLIGLLRINEMVVREALFTRSSAVTILQRLEMGRPLIGSFR